MQHLDEGTIHSWLDGALSADEAARVEAHVKECAQCQAAVAEARGFIAASSRILTALDNPPRGVIPAAAPKKRIDPMVWRIAASVLVVALGSVLVIREQGTSEKSSIPRETIDSTCAPNCPAPALGPPVTVLANPKSSAPAQTPARRNGATATTATSPTDVGAASAAPSAPSVAGGNLGARQDLQKAPAAAPRATAQPAPDRRFEEAEGRAAGVVAADAAMADEQPLRVVGRPRALGEKLTLYEVAPGDTVMLAEQQTVELQSVVTTGASTTRTMSAGAAAAPPEVKAAAKLAPTQAQSSAQISAAPPSPPPSASASFAQTPNGEATLTWRDPTNGNRMRLSGRHTRAELEEIRHRIERAKAAAADSTKKTR